ncbi:hypothetical protein [Alkalihalobacillus sp. LMS39]|uniref:hypothetical protein n=1 Tax=Alkalihalobacillus sp. LMS39 TaxID=2924032 RepID=UPI001FB30F18|nr:hypothetical protein [Alkalihalobacillus sp. LMS39]UOE92122.1 hypothetical protein MM271_12690 [Alkalihalobacillus sp. LMS39]
MLQVLFIWFVLIATYVLQFDVIKKDSKLKKLYIGFSIVTATVAVFLEFKIGLNLYIDFIQQTFGAVTNWVIGR